MYFLLSIEIFSTLRIVYLLKVIGISNETTQMWFKNSRCPRQNGSSDLSLIRGSAGNRAAGRQEVAGGAVTLLAPQDINTRTHGSYIDRSSRRFSRDESVYCTYGLNLYTVKAHSIGDDAAAMVNPLAELICWVMGAWWVWSMWWKSNTFTMHKERLSV